MNNEHIEYMVLSGSTTKAIMAKTGAKLVDVKYTALQLKREGVINEEEAQKYFATQETTTPAKKNAANTSKRGRPAKEKETPEASEKTEEETPLKVAGRRRRTKKV